MLEGSRSKKERDSRALQRTNEKETWTLSILWSTQRCWWGWRCIVREVGKNSKTAGGTRREAHKKLGNQQRILYPLRPSFVIRAPLVFHSLQSLPAKIRFPLNWINSCIRIQLAASKTPFFSASLTDTWMECVTVSRFVSPFLSLFAIFFFCDTSSSRVLASSFSFFLVSILIPFIPFFASPLSLHPFPASQLVDVLHPSSRPLPFPWGLQC